MRFICYVSDLKDAAKLVAKCADAKPQTPILAAVKISAENDRITFDATNFKVTAQINLPANIEETGSICVNAKLFAEIVNKAAEDIIRLETVDNKLKIEAGASKFELLTYSSDEFPTTNFDTDFNVKVRAAMLKKLIRRTVFAVTRENDRPIFKGVNFIFDDDELTAVATNAQRITIDKTHAKTFGDAFSAVVRPPRSSRRLPMRSVTISVRLKQITCVSKSRAKLTPQLSLTTIRILFMSSRRCGYEPRQVRKINYQR